MMVGSDNRVEWDPSMERVLLPSGKPLVLNFSNILFTHSSLPPPVSIFQFVL